MRNDTFIILEPVEGAKASEAIYTQIRDKIIDGEIAQGSRLPSERKMMEMVQRRCIRSYMMPLLTEGQTMPIGSWKSICCLLRRIF